MPSKSAAQHRLMMAVAHDPQFAAKANVPVRVGREFVDADKKTKRFGRIATSRKQEPKIRR